MKRIQEYIKEGRREEIAKNLRDYRTASFSMKDLVDSFDAYIKNKCKNGPYKFLDSDDRKIFQNAIKEGDWKTICDLNDKYHE